MRLDYLPGSAAICLHLADTELALA
jgi:hypothetical protein